MKRGLVIVLDSVGIGGAPDAGDYGDDGANTVGHLLAWPDPPRLPTLCSLGLSHALALAGGDAVPDDPQPPRPCGYAALTERSSGKDTTTGHWELAGVVTRRPFAVFDAFPPELVEAIEREARVEFLGNFAGSGTDVIARLGDEHVRTGKPILYTSADSVLQIAAHEGSFGLKRLYGVCKVARKHADAARIGRVIARPFTGSRGDYRRTPNRHDYSMVPPPTVLDALGDAGVPVVGIGKISDIFAGRAIRRSHATRSNAHGCRTIDALWAEEEPGFYFANLVDFDTLYGHRRDPDGYARALEEFDGWLARFICKIRESDLVVITADHGNDPTMPGTDHTRERVPAFVFAPGASGNLGLRESFGDVAASVARHFGVWFDGSGTPLVRAAETGA